jgi:ABC-type antimicrobial peptide transport system permease subunit
MMFFTYVYRELRRRHRQALLTSLGLAVGVALVVTVTAYASGVSKAQDEVLSSLYGVGTDITVKKTVTMGGPGGGPARIGMNPGEQSQQGKKFTRDAITSTPGQESMASSKVTTTAGLDHVSAAAGALQLTSLHVTGEFAQAFDGGDVGGKVNVQSGDSMPQPSASQAPIKISSYSIAGVDVTQMGLGPLSSAKATSGRLLTSTDAKKKVVVVDKSYARQKEIGVGDTMKVNGTKFEVVGIAAQSSTSTSTSNVYMPLLAAQKAADLKGKVNVIYVQADSAQNIAVVKKEIKTAMPKATVTTAKDLADQVSGSLSSASSLADRLGKWLAVAALVAAFLVASLLTVSAVSRRVREFGTLKALGWKSRRIVGQVLGESIVQGVAGGVIGVLLGIAGAWAITAFSPDLKATLGSSLQAPEGAPPGTGGVMQQVFGGASSVTVHLGAPVSLNLVLLAVGLALAGGLLAGALGGWRASRLRPADALRRLD